VEMNQWLHHLTAIPPKEIDSSNKEELGIHFDLNWEFNSSKPVVNEKTGQVNDIIPMVMSTSKKMKKIFRQEFKTSLQLIENKKMNDLTIKEMKNEEDIKTSPSKMKQELTLMKFGFKPSSSKCASSLSTFVSVAKMPNRKDVYSNNGESFETPPFIKKERSDHLLRKENQLHSRQ
jgi:hypothetical protein